MKSMNGVISDSFLLFGSVFLCKKHAGMGFQLFLSEHMEQKFTRLLILTAGEYEQDLKGMDQRIGITVVGTTKEEQMLYTNLGSSLDVVELPENLELEECYRIRC